MTPRVSAPLRRSSSVLRRFIEHPGRGGCGVGAVADLRGRSSRDVVRWALSGLACLEHRGGAMGDTGDGAGLLLQTDRGFFERFIAPGHHLPEGHVLSVGVLFLPLGEAWNMPHYRREIDGILRRHGLTPLGFRHVPTNESALGASARLSRRDIWQVLIGEGLVPHEDLPATLHRVKAQIERQVHDVYVASLSPSTLVYKALATGDQLRRFYPDLEDPDLTSRMVVFHRRYSTNTFSNWYLAQVFRTLCHNGEINTIKANRNAVSSLEVELSLGSLLMPQGSDSADMDRLVDLFVSRGVRLPETLIRMMPMAHRDVPDLSPEVRRFYQGVQRALGSLGAWEGPAAVLATDGRYLVGALDRMGLRPLRWMKTHSGRLVLCSEVGAIDVPFEDIAEAGQLDPGELICFDQETGQVASGRALVEHIVASTPINFAELAEERLIALAPGPVSGDATPEPEQASLNLFGWSPERVRNVKHMAESGKEPITSMGYDRPLAPFSAQRPPISKYFKQIVAVVTNPPIDPLREGGAFDLTVHLGTTPAVHENLPLYDPLPQYKLPSPFLTEDMFSKIRGASRPDRPRAAVIDATFTDPDSAGSGAEPTGSGAKALSRRIAEICRHAVGLVKRGEASILILSDRACLPGGAPASHAAPPAGPPHGRFPSDKPPNGPPSGPLLPLPMVLVTSALHNALVVEGQRRHAGIVVETGEVQEGHDAAVLLANGATAVYPYLFYAVGGGRAREPNLVKSLEEALRRIMSKMGICSVDGYRGSRLFEAVGIAADVVEHYLPGVVSRIGGIDLTDIYEDLRMRRAMGGKTPRESDPSVYRKEVWNELQTTARGHDPEAYGRFLRRIADTPPVYLRDLLELSPSGAPVSVDEVAPVEEVIRHVFRGAAMSHGALHRVAHRAIAAAFNHFGAMSNCGEGGEDPRRDEGEIWQSSRSRIRQVASGRFGVDARYLAHADELSIKIGQGAKPGEGGMLPAAKVTAEVAMIRKTQVGVTLISPPPHHDIYSIEDLAQLIYNLRQASPRARVSVKIPAVTDIGTIAVGIAKAGADTIDVSGFEGGTGAAASSSIEHAGLPLERALSETHQALLIHGARDRVLLRADGGIKTGADIMAVLALGADEVSLGTALMIAEQCIFCHGCANGLCPAGIATQSDLVARRLMTIKKGRPKDDHLPDEEEERFEDAKQGVMRYLVALGNDVRNQLAALGLRHPKELVGRVDLFRKKATGDARKDKVDVSELLFDPRSEMGEQGPSKEAVSAAGKVRLPVDPTSPLNARLIGDVIANRPLTYAITNGDRAFGATLAGAVAKGQVVLPREGLSISLTGYAGQALGFALVDGVRISLVGLANDGVGEAMGGGTISVRPVGAPTLERCQWSVVGNAACYGATGGRLFVLGRAGQRVGVRNSGAHIVVEGAGKYAFEYMTGGIGIVLGSVGPVVGSGLTGGELFLLDTDRLTDKLHADVKTAPIDDAAAERFLSLIRAHADATGSPAATALLRQGPSALGGFLRVVPA